MSLHRYCYLRERSTVVCKVLAGKFCTVSFRSKSRRESVCRIRAWEFTVRDRTRVLSQDRSRGDYPRQLLEKFRCTKDQEEPRCQCFSSLARKERFQGREFPDRFAFSVSRSSICVRSARCAALFANQRPGTIQQVRVAAIENHHSVPSQGHTLVEASRVGSPLPALVDR